MKKRNNSITIVNLFIIKAIYLYLGNIILLGFRFVLSSSQPLTQIFSLRKFVVFIYRTICWIQYADTK